MTEQNHRTWKHLVWIPLNGLLVFGLPFLMVRLLGLGADIFCITLILAATALVVIYTHKTELRWGAAIKNGWALGIIMGLFFGLAILALASSSNPGVESAILRPDAAAILWRNLVYGLATAALISVFPFIVTWRALAGSRPGMFRKSYVTLAVTATIGLTSILFNFGLKGISGEGFREDIQKSLATSFPTIISGSPLAAPISSVFLQISEATWPGNKASRAELPENKSIKTKTVPGGIN